jgi:hypothetical protein
MKSFFKNDHSVIDGTGYGKPRARRGSKVTLHSRYAGRLRTLGPVLNVEVHGLALGQDLEPIALDGGKMYEYVLTTIGRGDKSESLGFVEPLNSSVCHFDLPFEIVKDDQSLISKNRKTGILKRNLRSL